MREKLKLQPEKVFDYFQDLCEIPHGSGNTKAISDYCVAFAKEHGLEYYQDDLNNVIMIQNASAGYEAAPPIIIQGHLDMVCEKEDTCEIDFTKDGLDLYVDGDFLRAKGTTLGGDDGIAVAYALALLDTKELEHPRLEIILTVDEETGMYGVQGIDLSPIKGNIMLNIDSDEEGVFLTSCAGGMGAEILLPISRKQEKGFLCQIRIQGLMGGHSGAEIDKERASSNYLMGRVLKVIWDKTDRCSLVSLQGGLKDNAITRVTNAEVLIPAEELENLQTLLREQEDVFKKEYAVTDPDIHISCEAIREDSFEVLDDRSVTKVIFLLREMLYGVLHMSKEIPGLVETSANPGIMELKDDVFRLYTSIRSSVTSRKQEIGDRLEFLGEFVGAQVNLEGDYPAWEYKADSVVRNKIADTYRDLFHEEPKIMAIHAGLECGYFAGMIQELDAVSFGPKNLDIHTPQERLSISSTEKYWRLLVEYLKRAK